MKIGMNRTIIFGVIALFVSISISPMVVATELPAEEKYAVTYAMINNDGTFSEETILLDAEELLHLQDQLSTFLELFKSTTDKTILLNLLYTFLNGDNYPVLSNIIQYFLSSGLLASHELIVSEGWGYNLNPFKKMSIDIVKPVTLWLYGGQSNILSMPSSTVIMKLSPFEVKTLTGSQLGCMFRFRGIYVHIPQQVPMQSFTFFLGSARNAFGVAFPGITLPSS